MVLIKQCDCENIYFQSLTDFVDGKLILTTILRYMVLLKLSI